MSVECEVHGHEEGEEKEEKSSIITQAFTLLSYGTPQPVLLDVQHLIYDMDTFEDENPFETDSPAASSNVDISDTAPAEPPAEPPALSSSPPTSRPSFPSPGSQGRPKTQFKEDFCCVRDQWLHSGEDVEIQVRMLRSVCAYHENMASRRTHKTSPSRRCSWAILLRSAGACASGRPYIPMPALTIHADIHGR